MFIQDRDIGQLNSLESDLRLAGHEPVVIYSLTEILDMASHPHLAPDVVVAEAMVIGRTLRRLGKSTALMLRDLLAERLLVATGHAEDSLPMEVGARLPRPFPFEALEEFLVGTGYGGRNRRTTARKTCSDPVEVHLHNGGSYGPYAAPFTDLSTGGACLRIPPGGRIPVESTDATVDLWVQDRPPGRNPSPWTARMIKRHALGPFDPGRSGVLRVDRGGPQPHRDHVGRLTADLPINPSLFRDRSGYQRGYRTVPDGR